ncbi:hypothetical protein QQP08_002978 [Theobroma cacao]|nr:hypothetical protein QQP08_002978 [Theobroma cacao]
MSKAGALDLASGLGGKIEKTDVLSAVEKYEKYHVFYGGEEEERKANYTDMIISNFVKSYDYVLVCLLFLVYSVLLNGTFRYEKYHVFYGGEEEERKANYTDMVRRAQLLPILHSV